MAKNSFESNLENIDKIIEKIENGELSLNGKLYKVMEKNGDINIEEI